MIRALDRPHQYKNYHNGVDYCIHQYAGSASELGRAALVELGFRAHQAERVTKAFRKHDLDSVKLEAGAYKNESSYISHVRERLADFERQFEEDRKQQNAIDHGWDTDRLKQGNKKP
jgi:Arc/MetJ-type ribon-helix-helix transcriptional regulator